MRIAFSALMGVVALALLYYLQQQKTRDVTQHVASDYVSSISRELSSGELIGSRVGDVVDGPGPARQPPR